MGVTAPGNARPNGSRSRADGLSVTSDGPFGGKEKEDEGRRVYVLPGCVK